MDVWWWCCCWRCRYDGTAARCNGVTADRLQPADCAATDPVIRRCRRPGLRHRITAAGHVRSCDASHSAAESYPRPASARRSAVGVRLNGRWWCSSDGQEQRHVIASARTAALCRRCCCRCCCSSRRHLLPALRRWSADQRTCRLWRHFTRLRLPDDVTRQRDVPPATAAPPTAPGGQHDVIRTLDHHGNWHAAPLLLVLASCVNRLFLNLYRCTWMSRFINSHNFVINCKFNNLKHFLMILFLKCYDGISSSYSLFKFRNSISKPVLEN